MREPVGFVADSPLISFDVDAKIMQSWSDAMDSIELLRVHVPATAKLLATVCGHTQKTVSEETGIRVGRIGELFAGTEPDEEGRLQVGPGTATVDELSALLDYCRYVTAALEPEEPAPVPADPDVLDKLDSAVWDEQV